MAKKKNVRDTREYYEYSKDQNHDEMKATARVEGWYVEDMARVGNGFPDLLLAKGQFVVLVEVKQSKRSALTLAQYHWFMKNCRRLVALVMYSPEEIKRLPEPGGPAWDEFIRWYKDSGHLRFDRWRVKGLPADRPRIARVS